jgi:hypothetical protein
MTTSPIFYQIAEAATIVYQDSTQSDGENGDENAESGDENDNRYTDENDDENHGDEDDSVYTDLNDDENHDDENDNRYTDENDDENHGGYADENDNGIFLNTHEPFCMVTVGVQGAGKSHTTAAALEGCLIQHDLLSDVIRLHKPMAALVLHYDSSPSTYCEVHPTIHC